jgi:hypothetical protein
MEHAQTFIYNGIKPRSAKTILLTVIRTKIYNDFLWAQNIQISLTKHIKDVMRVKYNPPTEALQKICHILPQKLQYEKELLTTARLLVSSGKLRGVLSCSRSKTTKSLMAALVQITGHGVNPLTITTEDLKKICYSKFN